MTASGAVSAMLAVRVALRRANPDLLAWSERQWQAWLETRRTERPDVGKPPVIAIASLTCLDDLFVHVRLMQLLADTSKRVALVVAFPTEEAARLARAQARADGWRDLARIVTDGEAANIARRLSGELAVATFGVSRDSDDVTYLEGVTALLSLDPTKLPEAPAPVRRENPPKVTGSTGVKFGPSKLELAKTADGTEVVLRSGGVAFARQLTDLFGPDEALRIRPPASLLTTHSQPVDIECYSPTAEAVASVSSFHARPSQLKPWMIGAYLNRGGAGNAVIRAFAKGIGCRISYAEDEREVLRDIAVVWGVLRGSDRILAQAKARSLYFFYIDHAYFDRGHGKTYRITRNGYEAGAVRKCPADRLTALTLELAPWRKSGREIIVCPPTEYFMAAHDCADWLETTLETLTEVTERPIVLREKPKPGEAAVPLKTALKTAHALVTHSSNVAIEAACLGTPVFVNPASAAAPVGETDLSKIETPSCPDRDPWLAHLAYNQFSLDEIRSGEAWRLLMELEERDFA